MLTTIKFGSLSLEGELAVYLDVLALLTGAGRERLSIRLNDYGLIPAEGNFFIKDYSEHAGVTAQLVDAGAVEIVREVTFGPFNTRAYEVTPIF